MYLGNQVLKWDVSDGKTTWAMSSNLYVKRAVAEVEQELAKVGDHLVMRCATPMTAGYCPK